MSTRLIRLEDDTLVEVEASPDQVQPISGGLAPKVAGTLENLEPLLVKVCRPIRSAWKEMSREMQIDSVEVEIGFSFEGEGDVYVVKAKAGANLKVKLVLKPFPEAP